MSVQTFDQPDSATYTGSTYKGQIDKSIAVLAEVGRAFAPHAATTPDLTVKVDAGRAFVAGALVSQSQQSVSGFTATSSNQRIDRVVLHPTTLAASRVAGSESASPSAPAVPTGYLPCAQVGPFTTSSTAVTNSMITDERVAGVRSSAAALIAGSALGRFVDMVNGTIVTSRSGNAETIAIKTLAGDDPSAQDPVLVVLRNATAADGTYTVITLTAATSITINSTALVGATNATPFSLWVVGFNDAGTFRLGVINCLSGSDIYPLAGVGIASSTAMTTASDNAHVFYTGSAVTSKPYAVLAAIEYTLATAGTWNTAPTSILPFGPGVALPGQRVQRVSSTSTAVATGTTATPADDTIPQNTEGDQYLNKAITPSRAANLLVIEHVGSYSPSAAVELITALHQDSVANALTVVHQYAGGSGHVQAMHLRHVKQAASTSSQDYKIRTGGQGGATVTFNGVAGARRSGGVLTSRLDIEEIMV